MSWSFSIRHEKKKIFFLLIINKFYILFLNKRHKANNKNIFN